MANYCFDNPDERRALFNEACIRGWLAAILDFPRYKTREECTIEAMEVGNALRSEVCCIPAGYAYQQLVSSAWVSLYLVREQFTEREVVPMVLSYKDMSTDEALAFLRARISDPGLPEKAEIDRAYAQFIELTSTS